MLNSIEKRLALVVTILCGIGLLTCLLCNWLISGAITWAAYPALAIPYFWIVSMAALLSKKHAAQSGLAALSALALPFLFFLDMVTPGPGWFAPVALPICVASVGSIWLSRYIFKRVRRMWAVLAVIMFQYGILLNGVIQFVLSRYTGVPFLRFASIFDLASCFALMLLFVVLDVKKTRETKGMQEKLT